MSIATPTSTPVVLGDISLFLYHKETGHLERGSELVLGEWKVKVWIGNNKSIIKLL